MWTNSPDLSLGSNQVDFGGIILSASASAINSSIVVWKREKATSYSPSSTSLSSSPSPRIPPTKWILWSVLGFLIPRTGLNRLFCNIETSRHPTGSPGSKDSSLAESRYHLRPRIPHRQMGLHQHRHQGRLWSPSPVNFRQRADTKDRRSHRTPIFYLMTFSSSKYEEDSSIR